MDRAAKPRSRGGRKTELHIFDFDQTLFQSPGPPPNLPKKERGKFWQDPESLGGELVPDTPNENWYVRHVVDAFRRAKKNPRALVVVMTGRSESFRRKVKELLEHEDLKPDELVLKQEQEPTQDYKTREMKRILKEHPDVKKVHFHEDREEHLRDFQEAAEAEGYQFVPHHVSEANSDLTWDSFMEVFYDGGEKQVQNTNPESRDQHPTVRADHLMRTDPSFSTHVQRQFRKWVSIGKPKKRRKKATVLCLVLDLSPEATRSRVAARWLLRETSRAG
jgi:hypothetical protein